MIRTLVSVNKDLASSIALRYACKISNVVDIAFQTINIQEPGPEYNLPGTGWVRRTWETALWESGKDEIERLLLSEKVKCSVLGRPKIKVGDKSDEILSELQGGVYDLFMEGALSTFKVADFHKMIKSKLFRNMPSPAIIVKNLVDLESIAFVMTEGHNYRRIISVFSKIFKDSSLPLEIVFWKKDKKADLDFPDQNEWKDALDSIEKIMKEYGCNSSNTRVVRGSADSLARYLRRYGLVASGFERTVAKKSHLLELLAKIESPIMLLWQ